MKSDVLREKFLSFFKAKGHRIVESDSLVPKNDPTVLFTPAGMNQFKKEFLGYDCGYKRAATSQRCLRTDDLDKVGHTRGHHTFFEMLGNFSFGDYFKSDAIAWAWEFLTRELKISPEKLRVSVYQDDQEAYDIWNKKIGIPPEKISQLGQKENFWPANAVLEGPNGPCGPCSEIFFDRGRQNGCGRPDCAPSCDCGRFVEIWNLVFTQYNRKDNAVLEPLPNKNIDTGMGLERLTAVLQGADNNFETDLFQPIIKELQALSSKLQAQNDLLYAIADHLRAVAFAIYDGVLPSNDGRGYVVRKIIRKSLLHLRALGIEKPFLYKLVPVLAEIMRKPYPELAGRREEIAGAILVEEKNFISVLANSQAVFKEKFSGLLKVPNAEEAGRTAFEVYDTYGIPLEITRDWLKAKGVSISQAAFVAEMEKQKTRSKLKSAMKGNVFGTDDIGVGLAKTKFTGYKDYTAKAKILKILKDGREVKKINKGESGRIILDKTPFYAEGGGQCGDSGTIISGKNVFEVLDTARSGEVIVHAGKVKHGIFKKSGQASARVDVERRMSIARNHTATHLLQAALRQALGEHVRQQGSQVSAEKFRFDFSHFKALTREELERIEEIVYSFIIADHPVTVKEMPLAQAKKGGALAFFGEKYAVRVRVVSVEGVSRELCGGTHLKHTGQAGYFKILKEGSVASGIRRIEAATGIFARQALQEEQENLEREMERLRARAKEIEKQKESKKAAGPAASSSELLKKAETINGIRVISSLEEGGDINMLRAAADQLRQTNNNLVVLLGAAHPGRLHLVLGLSDDLTQKGLDASRIIPAVAAHIGGSGGGRKDFAQAGGAKPENFNGAVAELKKIIMEFESH